MKIGSKWGDVMTMKDLVESALYYKRLCIKTKLNSIIFETFNVIVQGKVYWARAKETNGWNPVFRKDEYGDNSSEGESAGLGLEGMFGDTIKANTVMDDSDVERVSEYSFDQGDKCM